MPDSQLHELVFVAEGLEPGVARVRRLEAREGLATPLRARVDLELPAPADPRAWLLLPAHVVVLSAADGSVLRRFSGVVTEVVSHATRVFAQRVSVTIESPLAVLRLVRDHRIFQQKTTQDIVSEVLDGAGIEAGKVSFRLVGSYPTREVCTQFGETSWDFVFRLLEEDGIFVLSEYGEDGPTLVFGDSPSAYPPLQPSAEIAHLPPTGLVSSQAVLEITESSRVRPAKVTLRDHDFKRPALDLEAVEEDGAPLGIEHYDYPGRYVEPAEGKRRAKLRLEAMAAAAAGARGLSTVFSLAAGHTFTLNGAPDGELDREWVARDVVHTWVDEGGSGPSYENRFHVLPKDMAFRMPGRTPRAVVPGPQLGVVTGPPGEEIHTDSFGRVKVHFFWDRLSQREDKSSAWIRVGQMHTSGAACVPRVGWEVLVDFEDGDPDEPVVVGRLYNGRNGPPYTLPSHKTMTAMMSHSSPGGSGHNEVRMDDGAGAEHFSLTAQKDLVIHVANDKTEKVATNETVAIGASETVSVGGSETVSVGGDASLTVGGAQTWSVGASRTKTISQAESISVAGSRSVSIGASHTTMTPRTASLTTQSSLSETVGGTCLEAAGLGVAVAVAGSASFTVGGAKVTAAAAGVSDSTIGANATTVGGAMIAASGGGVSIGVGGAKATTVGGVWTANAGGDVELSSGATLKITVGGAVAVNAAEVVLEVGGSSISLSGGQVAIKSGSITLNATGPHAELSPLVQDK